MNVTVPTASIPFLTYTLALHTAQGTLNGAVEHLHRRLRALGAIAPDARGPYLADIDHALTRVAELTDEYRLALAQAVEADRRENETIIEEPAK